MELSYLQISESREVSKRRWNRASEFVVVEIPVTHCDGYFNLRLANQLIAIEVLTNTR
jgi:hypothetical protein